MKIYNKFLLYSFFALTLMSTLHEKRARLSRTLASEPSTKEQIADLKQKICEQRSMLEKLQDRVENLAVQMTSFINSMTIYNAPIALEQSSPSSENDGERQFNLLREAYASSSYFAMANRAAQNAYTISYEGTPTEHQQRDHHLRQFDFTDNTLQFRDQLPIINNRVPNYHRSRASTEGSIELVAPQQMDTETN